MAQIACRVMSWLWSLICKGKWPWDLEFTNQRSLNFMTLEKPYVEWKAETGGGDLTTVQAGLLVADIVPMFMRDDDDFDISAEADKVEAFCSSITLRDLLTEAWEGGPPLEQVALLDERRLDGRRITNVLNQGPLTARQLYRALKDSRSRRRHIQPSDEAGDFLDTRQRHTYITDVDRWSICALVGTAPRFQKTAIRSIMYSHLQFQPRIHAKMVSKNGKFQLAFHLPYMPIRDSEAPNIDTRRFRDGSSLRMSQNVSFLNLRDNYPASYRYEAQISFVVIVADSSTWDTYLFEDTYFDPIQEGERLVEYYDGGIRDADGPRFVIGPSTRGRIESETPIRHPGQYFLTMLGYCLEHVTAECRRDVDRVNDGIRRYQQTEHDLQNVSKKRQPGRRIRGLGTIEWIAKVKDFLDSSLRELSGVVDRYKTFFNKPNAFFNTDLCEILVSEMNDRLEELESLKDTLENNLKQCESLIHDQQISLNQESAEAERKRDFVSKFLYPVVIGVGMFSMQDHVLPFKANTAAFVCVVLVLGVLIHLCYDPPWYWQAVLNMAGRVGSNERFQAMRLEFRELWRTKPANSLQSAKLAARIFPWRRDLQPAAVPGAVIDV